jgi:hypothetical protein
VFVVPLEPVVERRAFPPSVPRPSTPRSTDDVNLRRSVRRGTNRRNSQRSIRPLIAWRDAGNRRDERSAFRHRRLPRAARASRRP